MPINTDLNVTPYFDDYDEDKKFHKVLFRPSVPIQARELTQLQTILQNQVERFGDHVFKEGSIIKGCGFKNEFINYAKLNDANTSGTALVMSEFEDTYVRNSANLIGLVENNYSGFEATNPDLNGIYYNYVNTGNNSGTEVTSFSAGETLDVFSQNASINAVTLSSNTGTAYSNNDTISFVSTFGSNGVANLTTNSTGGIVGTSFNNTASQGHSYRVTDIPTITITTSTGTSANTDNFVVALTKKNIVTIANTSFEDSSGNAQFNTIGSATRLVVDDGVIYQKGHFTQVSSQSIIVDRWHNKPDGIAVGFNTTETIANNTSDTSLNDNASGFNNENAPGAYRLKLTPTLVVNTVTNAESTNNFFIIQRWANGTPIIQKGSTELNKLGDTLARRTREESGNYIVKPFTVASDNIASNTTHLNITVGPGKGYVGGFRTETLGTTSLPVEKATTTKNVSSALITTNYGQYQEVDELVGHFAFNHAAEVKLLDGASNRISTSLGTDVPTVPDTSNSTVITGTSPSFTGNILGTAKIRSAVYEKNTPGTPSGQYRLYLFDVNMNQGKRYQDVRSIWYNAEGIADVVLNDDNQAALKETNFRQLVTSIGREGIKTASIDGISNNQFIYRTAKTDGSIATNGSITFTVSGTETFPYTAEAFLNETQEKDWIIVANNNTAQTVSLTGTVAVTSGQGNVTGSSTTFTAEYEVGDFITVNSANTHRITSVVNNTLMVTANNFGASVSNKTHARYFPVDIPINIFDNSAANVYIGSNSNTVTINATRGKALHGSQTLPVHVYYNVKKTSAPPIQKTLATSFVKINCASHSATTTGTYSLGIPDVHDVLAVFVGNNTFWDGTTAANATVVDKTTNFSINTGQKDGFYGLAKLGANTGNSVTLISTDRLVAKVRHFKQDTSGGGKGFFNIDSYPVNDTEANSTNEFIKTQEIPTFISPVDGQSVDLRNAIDFRPYCANTADQQTTASAATVNPSATESFAASDHAIATPNENFVFDYQYYMPRIDRVLLNPDASMEVITGIPGETPSAPETRKGSLTLGVVTLPVYPTLSMQEAVSDQRIDYGVTVSSKQPRRYTMEDIGQIDKRINRLEYYSSLNMLEKQTMDLVIPAESNNAVDRFKQGFLVDSFKDFSVASVLQNDYKAAINKTEQTLVPRHRQYKIDLDVVSHSNTKKTGDLVTLDYTDKKVLEQRFATTSRSASQRFWNFVGEMDLYPNYDNFYETRNNPQGEINIDLDLSSSALSLASALNEITSLHDTRLDIVNEVIGERLVNSTNRTDSRTRGGQRITDTIRTDSFEIEREITETESRNLFHGDTSTTHREVGEFVTDISFSPFIREQTIHFHCYGLRPNKRHYVFFDKTDVNANTRPATVPDGLSVERDNFHPTGVKGANLVSNSTGDLFGIFEIPQGTFFVGERALAVADVDTFSDIQESAISSAEAAYNAYNFSADKSDLTLTTRATDFARRRTATDINIRRETEVEGRETLVNRTVTNIPPNPPQPQFGGGFNPGNGTGTAGTGVGTCFVKGTKIIMDGHTKKNIEDVVVGDKVHRHDGGTNEVLKLQNSGTTGGRKLGSINGGDYFFTEDHPLKTPDGWKAINAKMASQKYHIGAIGELRVGDTIIGHNGNDTIIETIGTKEVPNDTKIYNFELDGDHEYFANGFLVHNKDPIAQTFTAIGDEIIHSGMYITKMDLFFKQKHESLGVTVTIRKTFNGYPSPDVLPFSRVHLKQSEVNISSDAQTATVVTFKSPVYLNKGEQYTIVIEPDNFNPDYIVWTSKTGGKDVFNSQPVNQDGFKGSMFLSTDDAAWEPNIDEDIKFTLYRADFSSTTGTVSVQNKDYEYFTVNSINGVFKHGEIVFQSNASAQTTGTVVISTSNNVVTGTGTAFDTEYAAGQFITFSNSTAQDTVQINSVTNATSLILKGFPQIANTTGIAAHHTVTGKVFLYDSINKFLHLDESQATNSTFKFASGASVIGSDSGANATIESINNQKVSHFEPLLYKIEPTTTSTTMKVHANTASGDSGNTAFKTNNRNYFKDEVVVKSRSNDLTGKWKQYFTLDSGSNTVSPAIDTSSLGSLLYENIVDNDTTNEHLNTGNADSKYVSRVVTLDDGLDAEDLRVFLTAFKPGADNCDIKVFAKILNELDTDIFNDRHWTELELIGSDERSNDDNRFDYREYTYQIPQTPASTFVEKGQTYGNTTITTASDISSTITAGKVVKVTNSDPITDYQISTVASSNSTVIVLDEAVNFANNTGANIATVDLPQTAFKDPQNDKVVTYYNSGGTKFATYKVFAIKIVLLTDDISTVPAVKDYRAIALSV